MSLEVAMESKFCIKSVGEMEKARTIGRIAEQDGEIFYLEMVAILLLC